MIIRMMDEADLQAASAIHQVAFSRQQHSYDWLRCNLNGFPRFLSYVLELDGIIVGYITWVQKSGFRPEVILELEQLAVLPEFQSQGFGRLLIVQSLPFVKEQLALKGAVLKHIIVTTRADNVAQHLYASTLGASVEATIAHLYSADEVVMVARNADLKIKSFV